MFKSCVCHVCKTKLKKLGIKDGYKLLECDRCGLVQVAIVPEKFDTKKIYSTSSAGYQKNKEKDLSNISENKEYRKIIDFLEKKSEEGRVLDIGCSSGEFMYFAKQRGFMPTGVELNEDTALIAQSNGLDVFVGEVHEAGFKDESFDIVFLGDVVEHVVDPRALVSECFRILDQNGFLVIVTPNMNCFWAETTKKFYRVFQMPWSVATPPHHLYQFSDKNLDLLISEFDLSFEKRWYNHLPRLRYELGQTHLWGTFKQKRTVKSFLLFFFGFILYTKIFLLNKITKKIRKKDFGMVSIYRKTI